MRILTTRVFSVPAIVAVLLLAGCGGGGGGGPAANQPPIVTARLAGEAVMNATTVFDTAGTADPEGRAITRHWDYGDGTSGMVDSHVYATTGTFTAVHAVTDDQGLATSRSLQVDVTKCSAAGTQASQLSPYPTVCMQTSLGELVVEVYPDRSPVTAANFLQYVADAFYSGTLIHRVLPGFVIQGGGFTGGMTAKPPTQPAITLESNNGLRNWQYTLAMARTSVPDSATSQFFINLVDNFSLDYRAGQVGGEGYAVFGLVISGIPIVESIAAVKTGTVAGFSDVPLQDIVLRSAVRMP